MTIGPGFPFWRALCLLLYLHIISANSAVTLGGAIHPEPEEEVVDTDDDEEQDASIMPADVCDLSDPKVEVRVAQSALAHTSSTDVPLDHRSWSTLEPQERRSLCWGGWRA